MGALEHSMRFNFPSVITEMPSDDELRKQYKNYYKIARDILRTKLLKALLSESQNHRCAHCGCLTNDIPDHRRQATIEHIVPKLRGGTDNKYNLVMACSKCNSNRGDKFIPEEYLVCN